MGPIRRAWIFVALATALTLTLGAGAASAVAPEDEELEPLPDLLRDRPNDLAPGQRAPEPPSEPLTPEEEEQLNGLLSRAKAGDKDEQVRLAKKYFRGTGAPRDLKQAVYWFEKAAAQDSAEAYSHLGAIYAAGGRGVERDPKKAREYLRKAAAKKWPQALFAMGQQYRSGDLFERNDELAFRYFREAADLNVIDAQTNVGIMYMEGTGVAADPRAAVEAWRKADAKGDNARAKYYLGVAYWRGAGVERNEQRAVEYLKQAENRDFHAARKFLKANGK